MNLMKKFIHSMRRPPRPDLLGSLHVHEKWHEPEFAEWPCVKCRPEVQAYVSWLREGRKWL